MKQHTFENSSQIKTIRYFADDHRLEIYFVTGKVYEYYKVPESVYEGALTADSIGKYVNTNIKGKYEYKLIPF